ncbi:trypsin-like serine peptidase [Streptomyces jeddahensis]|uniref:Glutamyl endopeptidase n=1 Tax=Streptomyces jeddahensis TaxID=1716141 RepID=A0A177HKX3_9ACTN|nr:hypothetical protein [Streptomyces jeddahensis]OAH10858.1 hypothetical protein STSP_57000 [Streptomyces jeddahensis]
MRLPRLAAAATAAAAFIVTLLPGTAGAATGTTQYTATGVDVHQIQQSAEETRDYWTPERMREAIRNSAQAPAAKPPASRPDVTDVHGADEKQGPAALDEAVLPRTRTTGLRAAAATVSVSQEVPYDAELSLYNVFGRLFFTGSDGQDRACSAASIVSDNKNTIWTAAHCVHAGDGSGDAGWSTNVQYVPGYRDGDGPLGAWNADQVFAAEAWTESGDNQVADMAAIVVKPSLLHGNLHDAGGGALGYRFADGATDYSDVYTAGYPGEGYNRDDLTGERLMYCFGDTVDASSFNPFDDRLKMDCDMGAGASGSPLIYGVHDDNAQIVGAFSHTEEFFGERVNDDMFSSEHGTYASAVIDAASAHTP